MLLSLRKKFSRLLKSVVNANANTKSLLLVIACRRGERAAFYHRLIDNKSPNPSQEKKFELQSSARKQQTSSKILSPNLPPTTCVRIKSIEPIEIQNPRLRLAHQYPDPSG
jgi:hypothetical protein